MYTVHLETLRTIHDFQCITVIVSQLFKHTAQFLSFWVGWGIQQINYRINIKYPRGRSNPDIPHIFM